MPYSTAATSYMPYVSFLIYIYIYPLNACVYGTHTFSCMYVCVPQHVYIMCMYVCVMYVCISVCILCQLTAYVYVLPCLCVCQLSYSYYYYNYLMSSHAVLLLPTSDMT